MAIVGNYGNLNNASGIHDKLELEHSKKTIHNYMIYRARNVTVVDTSASTMLLTVKDIKTLIDQYINQHSINSTGAGKKIYITRGSSESETDPFITNEDSSIGYKDSKVRIYDENLLEQYLKDQGFETVNFETLPSIRDQIQLMRSTDVILGATGTGLVNELFMKDGKILIELRVEHGNADTTHRIVPEYYDLSVSKQHLYLALDVPDKQATTAIKKLKNLLDNLNLDSLIDALKKDLHL
jgi:capsular polysaccharide biosynthesis protein